MRILDLSAGKRAIWFNRMHEDGVWVDIREEMNPTVVCDTRQLPFSDGSFELVVFDPPHMAHGETSDMGKQYGVFRNEEIRDLVRETSNEAYRVTTPEALMCFKWNDHDVRLDHMIPLMEGWEPLFGHQVNFRARSATYWCVLRKRRPGYQAVSSIERVLSMMLEDREIRPVAREI